MTRMRHVNLAWARWQSRAVDTHNAFGLDYSQLHPDGTGHHKAILADVRQMRVKYPEKLPRYPASVSILVMRPEPTASYQ